MAALADLPALAVRLSSALDKGGIPHAISGAVAMAAHGYIRATQDLDVLVVASAMQLPRVFEIVRAEGFEGEDRDLIEAIRERYVAALHSGPVTVEVLVPVLPYHRTLVDRAIRMELPGGDVPFVTVEDLIVLKMLWHRAKVGAPARARPPAAGAVPLVAYECGRGDPSRYMSATRAGGGEVGCVRTSFWP